MRESLEEGDGERNKEWDILISCRGSGSGVEKTFEVSLENRREK